MLIVVIEYRYTTPHVVTAADEAEARRQIADLAQNAKRATVYRHVPGLATTGMMHELFSVAMERA